MCDGMQMSRLHSTSSHYPFWMPKTQHLCAMTFVMLYMVGSAVMRECRLFKRLKVSGTATFEPTNITTIASGMAVVMLRKTSM